MRREGTTARAFPVRLVEFEVMRDRECFDADVGLDPAAEVREYFIPDFNGWKDYDNYRKASERLLRDLNRTAEAINTTCCSRRFQCIPEA